MAKKRTTWSTPSITSIFGSSPVGKAANVAEALNEPMVDEQMGSFGDIRIPVSHLPGAAQYWGAVGNALDYVTPQTQEEHNKLLNTYYNQRTTNPKWKEMGRAAEKDSPHYNDKDNVIRKDIGARSSVVQDIGYNKDQNLAYLKIGNNWYTYAATPEQFKAFLQAGSLGREMNNIKNGKSTSISKTSARKTPNFMHGGISIRSLFGV